MKHENKSSPRTALTGSILTGSAALAANAQTPNSSHTGTSDDVKNVLVTDDSATRASTPTTAKAAPKAASKAAAKASDNRKADDKRASVAKKAARPAESGDDNGGSRTMPEPGDDNGGMATDQTSTGSGTTVRAEPGDDKGGLRSTPEPGDDNGGHGRHGSDD